MTYLNSSDRDQIAVWFAGGVSIREIARRLERDHSVISRELKRNKTGKHYVAIAAQAKAKKRKHNAGLRPPLKNPELYSQVLAGLRDGWSPEQIAGRLKKENDGETLICHETIYNFIFKPESRPLRLWQELSRGHAKRRKWHGRKASAKKIPNRVSIHDRPEEIETREEFGHWEGDSVVGRGKHHGIHTEVERKTRYLLARLLPKLDSLSSVEAQKRIFGELPESARKTTTLDNGLEFVRHQELTEATSMEVYFADPYASGQRGTNENTNGLLRRYLPKKTSFRNLSQGELNDIVAEINNRPRKCLGYATPHELFIEYTNERS